MGCGLGAYGSGEPFRWSACGGGEPRLTVSTYGAWVDGRRFYGSSRSAVDRPPKCHRHFPSTKTPKAFNPPPIILLKSKTLLNSHPNKKNNLIMKAHIASLINALLLVGLGAWGYLSSETPSMTALIPVIIGGILLLLNGGVKRENKVIAHIAVLLTLLILLGLVMPLKGAMGRGDTMATARVAIMILSTIMAMVFFVKSFIDARKAREAQA